jgi:hypothetical protein
MNDTTKMVMLPQDAYRSLLSQQHEQTQPVVNQLTSLDGQLQSILANPSLPADVKYHQYDQLLHRYRHLKQQQMNTLNQPVPVTFQPAEQVLPPQMQFLPVPEENVLTSVPKMLKNKTRILLDHIKRHPEKFKWNEKGELVIGGEPVHGSHFTDLVHDTVRSRTKHHAMGRPEFGKLLSETNVPREGLGQDLAMMASTSSSNELPVSAVQGSPIGTKKTPKHQKDLLDYDYEDEPPTPTFETPRSSTRNKNKPNWYSPSPIGAAAKQKKQKGHGFALRPGYITW